MDHEKYKEFSVASLPDNKPDSSSLTLAGAEGEGAPRGAGAASDTSRAANSEEEALSTTSVSVCSVAAGGGAVLLGGSLLVGEPLLPVTTRDDRIEERGDISLDLLPARGVLKESFDSSCFQSNDTCSKVAPMRVLRRRSFSQSDFETAIPDIIL